MHSAVLEVGKALADMGIKAYLVGGAVRNSLLGLPAYDFDVASAAMPEDVLKIKGAVPVNPRLGTVAIMIDGVRVEHTTFRRESYGEGGEHVPNFVELGATLEDDAFRRDFSVNAIYQDILEGNIIDPTGRGLEDIRARILRSTTYDPSVILRDDGLRLLRMIRFAAELNFKIHPELFVCAKANAHIIKDVHSSRIREELSKILVSDGKYGIDSTPSATVRGLCFLAASGLLDILIPEFKHARDMGRCRYHKYSVLFHTIYTCAALPCDLMMRLAGLMHDIGKPTAWMMTGKMRGHDAIGSGMTSNRLKQLGFPSKLCSEVSAIVAVHMFDIAGRASERKVRIMAQNLGKERFLQLIDIRRADLIGSGKPFDDTAKRMSGIYERMIEENVPFSVKELAVTGADIAAMGFSGKQIGKVLSTLLHICATHPAQNERSRLLWHAGNL